MTALRWKVRARRGGKAGARLRLQRTRRQHYNLPVYVAGDENQDALRGHRPAPGALDGAGGRGRGAGAEAGADAVTRRRYGPDGRREDAAATAPRRRDDAAATRLRRSCLCQCVFIG